MYQLHNNTAFVTGAGSGIGRAVAIELAKRGARLWISDISATAAERVTQEIRDAGGIAHALEVDVTKVASLVHAAESVFNQAERLDVLVANAGVSTMNHFLELSEEEWDLNFQVNAKGSFLTIQTFAKRMVKQPIRKGSDLRGKIIATASMAARQAAPLLAHYSASKFAVSGLVQAVAKELAKHKLTVNAINPGFVKTSMQDREISWEAELRGVSQEQVIQDYIDLTPLGRIETPEDVAKVVAFLAGPDADFMTGEIVEINGGAYMT